MKPCSFEYVRPGSLSLAINILAQENDARVMAGGQSLIPMMNLRVVTPGLVVDVSRIAELTSFQEDSNAVSLGACVTHAEIEDRHVPDPSMGLMPRVASTLSYRAVRIRGTVGGSLALADPSAEWPTVLTALSGRATLISKASQRDVDIGDFVSGIYQTSLEDGELVERVTIPKLSARARWGYVKFARKSGAFANSIAVVIHDPERHYSRAVLGAANGSPVVLEHTTEFLRSSTWENGALRGRILADLHAAANDRSFDEFQIAAHAATIARAMLEAIR